MKQSPLPRPNIHQKKNPHPVKIESTDSKKRKFQPNHETKPTNYSRATAHTNGQSKLKLQGIDLVRIWAMRLIGPILKWVRSTSAWEQEIYRFVF